MDLGERERAKEVFYSSLNIKIEHFGEDHIEIANILGNLG